MKRLLLVFTLLALGGAHGSEMRTWTSSDGGRTVTAEFFSQDDTEVTLLLQNGRSARVPKSQLSPGDLEYLENIKGVAETASSGPEGKLADALGGKLVDEDGNPAEIAGNPEYYLFYYSASWCGPCKAFTPELVRFSRRVDQYENLQIVLNPSDRSHAETVAYLKDFRMPWPAIRYEEKAKGIPAVPPNPTGYIPAMVLTDRDGKVLLANGDGLPRDAFLEKAKDLVASQR